MSVESATFDSSNLASATWDSDSGDLNIVFQKGRSYTVSGVPQERWLGLKTAPSAGKYYNEFIKEAFDVSPD